MCEQRQDRLLLVPAAGDKMGSRDEPSTLQHPNTSRQQMKPDGPASSLAQDVNSFTPLISFLGGSAGSLKQSETQMVPGGNVHTNSTEEKEWGQAVLHPGSPSKPAGEPRWRSQQ